MIIYLGVLEMTFFWDELEMIIETEAQVVTFSKAAGETIAFRAELGGICWC